MSDKPANGTAIEWGGKVWRYDIAFDHWQAEIKPPTAAAGSGMYLALMKRWERLPKLSVAERFGSPKQSGPSTP